jgi:hypothetical protein
MNALSEPFRPGAVEYTCRFDELYLFYLNVLWRKTCSETAGMELLRALDSSDASTRCIVESLLMAAADSDHFT